MSKAGRVTNVQTPGVDQSQVDEVNPEAGTVAELSTEVERPAMAPDIQAMIDAAVARALAQRTVAPAAVKATPLPTQEEALAQVKVDPKHRSVLSVDGWVTWTGTAQPAGFAKA